MCNKASCDCQNCGCSKGASVGAPPRTSDLDRMMRRKPSPFRTRRYPMAQDPYGEHLRYGLAKGILSSSHLRQMGLDHMGYQPMAPRFVQTAEGTMIGGTNTSYPPQSAKPYNCRSEVIAALAYGLKYGLVTYDMVAAIGLDGSAIRTCLP